MVSLGWALPPIENLPNIKHGSPEFQILASAHKTSFKRAKANANYGSDPLS